MLRISKDARALDIQRATDAGMQRVDVLAKCALKFPDLFAHYRAEIDLITRHDSLVGVTFGTHCGAEVSLADLSVRCIGCD